MKTLIDILKQDKSDRSVIIESLKAGYSGAEIRKGLMQAFPLTCSDFNKAADIYNDAVSSIPLNFSDHENY